MTTITCVTCKGTGKRKKRLFDAQLARSGEQAYRTYTVSCQRCEGRGHNPLPEGRGTFKGVAK